MPTSGRRSEPKRLGLVSVQGERAPGREEPLGVLGGERLAEEVALAEAAADVPQVLRLSGVLDPLGDGEDAERVGEPKDRVDEARVGVLPDERVDEQLRDLQQVDRELRKTAEGRITRAEVVDRQRDAEVAEPEHRL